MNLLFMGMLHLRLSGFAANSASPRVAGFCSFVRTFRILFLVVSVSPVLFNPVHVTDLVCKSGNSGS